LFHPYFGGPSLIDNDRRGAGLDLPAINRWISVSTNEIESLAHEKGPEPDRLDPIPGHLPLARERRAGA
jgi:hypothetical protein